MHMHQSIGRVRGLAAALGVGTAALFLGCGVAHAESSPDPGPDSATSGPADSATSGSARVNRSVAVSAARPNATRTTRPTARGAYSPASPTSTRAATAALPTAAVRSATQAQLPAPATSAAAALSARAAVTDIVDGMGGESGSGPLPEELQWAASAFTRRQPLDVSADIAALAPRGVQVVTDRGISLTVATDTTANLIAGVYNATSERTDVALAVTALGGSAGGKMDLGTLPNLQQSFTALPYATWLDPNGTRGIEQFRFSVREYTRFDQFVLGIPLFGAPVIHFLQDTPLIRDLLAPLIGNAMVATVGIDVAALAPGETPVAYTYRVASFDGTRISANFFPQQGLTAGATAPTAIIAPGFGFAGSTNPFALYALKDEVPGVFTMRTSGYNVLTYDPRGRFASGGQVHLANPDFEGRDVSALIDFIAATTPADTNAPGDPKVGLLGGSYGAALQFAAAADDRIDAMVPVDGWDSLVESFYPGDTFKTGYGALTVLSLLTTGSRVYPPLYLALGSGLLLNRVGPWGRNLLDASDPPLAELTAPTLLIRGTHDVLFPLQQGTANAEAILALGDVPLKMLWFCGGHGVCNNPVRPDQAAAMLGYSLAWMQQYVKGVGTPADNVPTFEWFDQRGDRYNSSLMPFQAGFNDLPDVVTTGAGGLLGIAPVIGGSGGLSLEALVNGSKASNAINIAVPTADLAAGTQVVGTPTVSFSYRGLGSSGAVYAQVVNTKTGLVLGNVVTPVPVRLDGVHRTVTVDIGEIAYTVGEDDSLEVQITSSATPFLRPLAFGVIDIGEVTVTLPNRTRPS